MIVVLSVIFFLISLCVSQNNGIEMIISQSIHEFFLYWFADGLTEINALVDDLLPIELTAMKIPDQKGEFHIPVLGKFEFTLTNLKVSSCLRINADNEVKSFNIGKTRTAIKPNGLLVEIPMGTHVCVFINYQAACWNWQQITGGSSMLRCRNGLIR